MDDPAECTVIDEAVWVAAGAARSGGVVLVGATAEEGPTGPAATRDEAFAALVEDLRATFPDHHVVGDRAGADHGHVWHVEELSAHCVAVALHCRETGLDTVVAGAVYDPVEDELYCAGMGYGATRNGAPMRVDDAREAASAPVAAPPGFPVAHRQPLAATPSLGVAQLAAGAVAGYVDPGTAVPDLGAALLVLTEAGGVGTDPSGRPFAGRGVVASNGALHEELLDALRLTAPPTWAR